MFTKPHWDRDPVHHGHSVRVCDHKACLSPTCANPRSLHTYLPTRSMTAQQPIHCIVSQTDLSFPPPLSQSPFSSSTVDDMYTEHKKLDSIYVCIERLNRPRLNTTYLPSFFSLCRCVLPVPLSSHLLPNPSIMPSQHLSAVPATYYILPNLIFNASIYSTVEQLQKERRGEPYCREVFGLLHQIWHQSSCVHNR